MSGSCDVAIRKVEAGDRLDAAEAYALYTQASTADLGRLADLVRARKHPEGFVTYIIDRNVNYTNICVARCNFCAFYRTVGSSEGYVLAFDEIFRKIDETRAVGGDQLLLQGGHNPDLPLAWYEDLFRAVKARYPGFKLHALSPSEILHISRLSKLPTEEVIQRLIAAGLDSVPGGGAEILVDRVRKLLNCYSKSTADEWLGIMRQAHRAGLRTTATMMYGSVETVEERIEHLMRLRALQDLAIEDSARHDGARQDNARQDSVRQDGAGHGGARQDSARQDGVGQDGAGRSSGHGGHGGGFTAFIAWSYQPEHTELGLYEATGVDYLRTLALARIVLDNFDNLQASWVTQGGQVGQLSLAFGANDMGSVMIEENVVRAAGASYCMDEIEIVRNVENAGFVPKRRNMHYEILGDPIFRERALPRRLSLDVAKADGEALLPDELSNYAARSRAARQARQSVRPPSTSTSASTSQPVTPSSQVSR